ncbi:MAG: hypothetical protein NTU85_03300 [Candidatus Kaiserbacteria bacterium]|nr:hypothetical protein [Candidatus Kaiserbacteria bacterium]
MKNFQYIRQAQYKKGFAPLIALFVVAGILIAGGAGYWFYQNNQNKTQTPQLIGGQKDSHGCLGPAGYSWCEVKQKCLRVWEESCTATSSSQTVETSETAIATTGTGNLKFENNQWYFTERLYNPSSDSWSEKSPVVLIFNESSKCESIMFKSSACSSFLPKLAPSGLLVTIEGSKNSKGIVVNKFTVIQ